MFYGYSLMLIKNERPCKMCVDTVFFMILLIATTDQAPRDLEGWRMPGETLDDAEAVWAGLEKLLSAHGYTPWPLNFDVTFWSPGGRSYPPCPSGYGYVRPSRAFSDSGGGTLRDLTRFYCLVRRSITYSFCVSITEISLSCRHPKTVLSVLPMVVMLLSES